MKKLLIALILIAVLVMSIGTAFAAAPVMGEGTDGDTPPITSHVFGDGEDGGSDNAGDTTTKSSCKGGAPVMALALVLGAVVIGKRK